ncbi:hypothetical protein V5N11_025231 [Cardamine amara subsp. amara]|uniref:Uncharacterized protein n=1 Tax=Cardamine amara subsp. amara TaxID=228776 RepID=A0ABD1BDJ3_CARAN
MRYIPSLSLKLTLTSPLSPPPPAIVDDSETTVANDSDSNAKCQTSIQSLATIVTTTNISSTISLLLDDDAVSTAISSLLSRPDSDTGDNNLYRWFYDTFQSAER